MLIIVTRIYLITGCHLCVGSTPTSDNAEDLSQYDTGCWMKSSWHCLWFIISLIIECDATVNLWSYDMAISRYCTHQTLVYSCEHKVLLRWIHSQMGRGHGGRVVTLLSPTSEAGVRFLTQPQVGKLVVACRWLAVYSTEPWQTLCTGFLCPSNYPSWYDLYNVESM